MRTAAHYHKLFQGNPGSTVGLSLAAQAVYASRHGSFDHTSPDYNEEIYRDIYLDFKTRYGETLSSTEALQEMSAPNTDDIKRMRRKLEEEIRIVVGSLLDQDRGYDAGALILALRRELTRHLRE